MEDAYWRENYSGRHYVDARNALRRTTARPTNMAGNPVRVTAIATFDQVENDMERGWDKVKGESKLGWVKAKSAVRDAWHRVERAIPGDADHDGR